jgi:hypothetical protein
MALSRGMQSVVAATALNALALVFIILRCVSRFWIMRQPGLEDYIIIIAFFLSVFTTTSIAIRESFS